MVGYFLAGSTIGPVVSQSLLDFMIFLIFICFVLHSAKLRFKNFTALRRPHPFEYGFILYFLAVILGFFVLEITDLEAWIKLTRFNWIINFYLFVWAFSQAEINVSKLVKFFTWAFILPNIYALISVFYGYDFIHKESLTYNRLTGLLGSSTYHAHANGMICIFFLTLLAFKFKELNKFYKIFSAIAASLMLLGIYMTFTRGVWVSLFISTLILLWFHNRRIFLGVIVSGFILTATLYTVSETFRERMGLSAHVVPALPDDSEAIPIDTLSSDKFRINLLKLHFLMLKDSPLLGIGYVDNLSHTPPATWEKYGFSARRTINTHAHNQFVNTLTTTGLLGFISFLLFYLWFFVTNLRLVNQYKKANLMNHYTLAVACLMVQLEFMIANMTDVGFEYSKIRSLILLVWAVVFVLWTKKVKLQDS